MRRSSGALLHIKGAVVLIVRVELHNANDGTITEIARMKIANDGRGDLHRGNYNAITFTGRTKEDLDREGWCRTGYVNDWPRMKRHVWELVMGCLDACGYSIPKRKLTAYARQD